MKQGKKIRSRKEKEALEGASATTELTIDVRVLEGSQEESQSSALPKREEGPTRGIWCELLRGVSFALLIAFLALLIEWTTPGKQLELMGYNYLQTLLSSQSAPITLVDISDLKATEFHIDGQTGTATPRDDLRAIIEAVADQEPAGIGVDIDFSPDEAGYIYPRDPEFFQFCLSLSKDRGVPIYLGIHRTIGQAPAEWLGSEQYESLAANILIPNDSRRMEYFIASSERDVQGAVSSPSKGMSAALANAYGKSQRIGLGQKVREFLLHKLQQLRFIEDLTERRPNERLIIKDFLVDFGPIDSIETIRTKNPVVLRDRSNQQRLQEKLVLIGNATLSESADKFSVPGRQQLYSGIFLHACAAYTLIKAPLYEVTRVGHFGIDLLFSLSVLFPILLIQVYYSKNRAVEKVAIEHVRYRFTFIVVTLSIILGVIFVGTTRIMWADFVLVLLLLLLHPKIEQWFGDFWTRLKKIPSIFFHWLVFGPRKERKEHEDL